MSRLQRSTRFEVVCPGALPQAVTFRAFGASKTELLFALGRFTFSRPSLWPHVRKQDHVADRLLVR